MDSTVPPELLMRSAAQRHAVDAMEDVYARLVASQLLVAEPERLAGLWDWYDSSVVPLDRCSDPIVVLATRIVAPVREARRVLRQQGGDVGRSIRQLQQFLELAEPENPLFAVAEEAIEHLGCPGKLKAVFMDDVVATAVN